MFVGCIIGGVQICTWGDQHHVNMTCIHLLKAHVMLWFKKTNVVMLNSDISHSATVTNEYTNKI